MFDKLIVSEPEGADFKDRRGYFVVSSIVVGALFLTAVVISIYASDFNLDNNGLDLAELLPPSEMAAVDPQPAKPAAPARSQSQLPSRQDNMSRTDEPTIVPTNTSTSRNTGQSRPFGKYEISKFDSDPAGSPGGSGRDTGGSGGGGNGLTPAEQVTDKTPDSGPPPVREIPVRRPVTKSLGVINGRASYLPKPLYPAAAVAVNAQGKVDVEVTIAEDGKVLSVRAINGNALLRAPAEKAAWSAKFTPTLLSNIPVKVTGVIVYNFTR